ncbi:MAG: hypothetical protein Q4C13_02335, partial [Clostridia bacterium]|nr:hypothetical protein [Clostridia bacterium]
MKRTIPLLLLTLLLCALPGQARAEETAEEGDLSIAEGIELWLNDIDWSAWELELNGLPEELKALLAGLGTRESARRIAESGALPEDAWGGEGLLDALSGLFLDEIARASGFFAVLLGIVMIGGALAALTGEKGESADNAA